MPTPYLECADRIRQLHAAVVELELSAEMLKLRPLAGREWYEQLTRKLIPQLRADAYLVVAVVGGTNIGKSVVFNHIAGTAASATSPLASGTKHPVCLVPPGFENSHDLGAIFHDFGLEVWTHAAAALEDQNEDRLYWQRNVETPDNLLILDTPDIDSDAQVNWHRADKIRHAADVLVAVLTQQKYNDAAVKQFFRKAAAEDKAVIVVFNQCQLPEDEAYWPLWLETFCGETGVSPEYVYVVPNDRAAAEEIRLPFFERNFNRSADADDGADSSVSPEQGRSLADDLSRLRFGEIKFRTLHGSLRQLLAEQSGVRQYLDEISQQSAEFRLAAERLSTESVVKVRDWPTVPNAVLVEEIRSWWRSQQEGWARRVNAFYDAVGRGVAWPFRFARERFQAEPIPPMDAYRRAEWAVVLRAVEEVYEKLSWMSETGNELLQPHFESALAGSSRAELLERLRTLHEPVDLCDELKMTVAEEMQKFQTGSPELYRFYRNLNTISAGVRPVTSIVLFTLGWGPAGHVVAPFLTDAAIHAVVPIVADFAGGAAAAVAGETALTSAAGTGAGLLQAKFQKLHTAFTTRRVGWLVRLLKEHLLGTLPEDLTAVSEIPQSPEYDRVKRILVGLQTQFAGQKHATTVES